MNLKLAILAACGCVLAACASPSGGGMAPGSGTGEMSQAPAGNTTRSGTPVDTSGNSDFGAGDSNSGDSLDTDREAGTRGGGDAGGITPMPSTTVPEVKDPKPKS